MPGAQRRAALERVHHLDLWSSSAPSPLGERRRRRRRTHRRASVSAAHGWCATPASDLAACAPPHWRAVAWSAPRPSRRRQPATHLPTTSQRRRRARASGIRCRRLCTRSSVCPSTASRPSTAHLPAAVRPSQVARRSGCAVPPPRARAGAASTASARRRAEHVPSGSAPPSRAKVLHPYDGEPETPAVLQRNLDDRRRLHPKPPRPPVPVCASPSIAAINGLPPLVCDALKVAATDVSKAGVHPRRANASWPFRTHRARCASRQLTSGCRRFRHLQRPVVGV